MLAFLSLLFFISVQNDNAETKLSNSIESAFILKPGEILATYLVINNAYRLNRNRYFLG